MSRQLCEGLGWKQANGAMRDVVCRGLLLMLARAGQIELPPVRRHIRGQCRTGRPRPEAVLINTAPLAMPLGALGPIEIDPARRTADEPLFNSLMEHYHYLGSEQPVGEHLKYVLWAQGRPIACLAWSSAPRHLGSRDRFIGWNAEARRRNIRFLAYNTRSRFLWKDDLTGRTAPLSRACAMNGYQRIQASLRGEQPDQPTGHAPTLHARRPGAHVTMAEFRQDPRALARSFIQSVERYSLNGVMVDVDTATLAGALGVPVEFPADEPAVARGARLASLADLDTLPPPDIARYPVVQVWVEAVRLFCVHDDNEVFIRRNCDQCPFALAAMVRGMEGWLTDIMDPELERSPTASWITARKPRRSFCA